MANQIFTVSEVNRYVKTLLCSDPNLMNIQVKGEISNFKIGPNGHLYFSIKDDSSIINVAMFANSAKSLTFIPKNGDEVVLLASIDAYPPRGTYSLICLSMYVVGAGNILLELEKLKKQLFSEGLFDASRKRNVTLFPKKIGVITARNSAAIKDIVYNINRRYPICEIHVFYSSVQGDKAALELLNAFNESQKYDLDTLIIGRGGGANEDLSAFNDEKLVRAISNSKMPVIAAIGHEIDSTLVDFVADRRASTPTAAAELATIDVRELNERFIYAKDDMKETLLNKISDMKDSITSYKEDIKTILINRLEDTKKTLKLKKDNLVALNPKMILERGYSITLNDKGEVIKDAKQVKQNDKLVTKLANGEIISEVI